MRLCRFVSGLISSDAPDKCHLFNNEVSSGLSSMSKYAASALCTNMRCVQLLFYRREEKNGKWDDGGRRAAGGGEWGTEISN